jgi:predicted amidophosphoribosyltransferase
MRKIGMKDTALRLKTSTLQKHLIPIPFDGPDVCPICRGWRHARWSLCSNCLETESVLLKICRRVIPMTLYSRPSVLRDALTHYKSVESSEPCSRRMISLLVRRYALEHSRCLQELVGGFSVVCPVPSSDPHKQMHPLQELLPPDLFGVPMANLLRRGTGELGHRKMSDRAYVVQRHTTVGRVLLLDDVYTTGASAQSAAASLSLAGTSVAGILVVARRINSEFNETAYRVWSRQSAIPYRFSEALSWAKAQP